MIVTVIKNWIKWKVAGDELDELWRIKNRAGEVKFWMSMYKDTSLCADFILGGQSKDILTLRSEVNKLRSKWLNEQTKTN